MRIRAETSREANTKESQRIDESKKISFSRLIISILACEAIGGIGSIFTIGSVSTWYVSINKPWFTPPNALFGPVWITLFLLMGVSLFLLWRNYSNPARAKTTQTRVALIAFGAQLALNVLWTALFFGLQMFLVGFVEIVILWGAIALTIVASYRVSKTAGLVLLPYIAWVTIAALLNYNVWILNI